MPEHFVIDYREAEETLRLPDLHQALYDADTVFLPRTVVCLHGEDHTKKKRIFAGVFNRRFFKHYQNHVFPKAIRETMDPAIAAGGGDMAKFAYRVLINLTADSAGIDRRNTEADTDRLLALLSKLGHAPTMGQLTDPSDRDRLLAELEEALTTFRDEFFEPSLARRKAIVERFNAGEITRTDLPQDAITAQLLSDPTDDDLPYDERMKDAAFFILAGAFTTANVLMNMVNNVLDWFEDHPEDRQNLLRDPILMQKFIWENTRLHPASPITKRRALCPMHLPDGHDAVQDEYVTVDLTKTNRLQALFGEDAEQFNPHRDLSDNLPLHGLSFGSGPHVCLGKLLAVGVKVTEENKDAEETEVGTIALVMRELLRHGIARDPAHPSEIDESTARRHFKTLPFVFDSQLAIEVSD
ncbi:MAG: cytochrome P450 [Alphaproteobacteria bacterium]|nr:cytochrome P450 [Alphaproteobacteria bacterium]